MFLQQLITGLSVGSIYALMAVGYSLIYSLLNSYGTEQMLDHQATPINQTKCTRKSYLL